MATLNKVMLVGHLGAAPELKSATADKPSVATMRIATNRTWKDRASGERKEATEWHSVVAFGSRAEACAKYLGKGSLVYVEGRLATRSWENADGATRFKTEVQARIVEFLGARRAGDRPTADAEAPRAGNDADRADDQIPF